MRGTIPRTWMEVRARPEWLGAIVGLSVLLLFAFVLAAVLSVGDLDRGSGFTSVHAFRATTATAAPAANDVGTVPPDADAMTSTLLQPFQEKLQPITPAQAMAYNANIPLSKAPNPPARPFAWSGSAADRTHAEDCLTAAVYYEAGYETDQGQRAVAQVVLNRVRHFAYPKTVCGVVFQGSDKPSGCQFTFTCDGSMARPIGPDAWDRAHRIAKAALAGKVEKSVGNATHYHADYVAPYWQPTLLKVAVIGRHIFYRGADGWGTPAAFSGRYTGGEPATPTLAAAMAVSPATAAPIVRIAAPPVETADEGDSAGAPPVAVTPPAPLLSGPAPATAAPPPAPAAVTAPPPARPESHLPHAPVQRRLPMASG